LSEVLNEEIGQEEKGGISRRRVAAGVAWSVPVILTTVAAPPASASPGKYEALLDYANLEAANFVQFDKPTNSGQYRSGLGPTGFHLKNSSGVASGPVKGSISISSANTADPSVGVYSFSGGTLTATSTAPGKYTANFELQAGVANGATAQFSLGFYYTGSSKTAGAGKKFNLTVSFSSPTGLLDLATELTLN